MTQQHWGNSGSKAYADWHRFRQRARETAMSEEEFDPIQRERYDLDTAGINGEENPDTYTTEIYGPREQVVDRRNDDLMD